MRACSVRREIRMRTIAVLLSLAWTGHALAQTQSPDRVTARTVLTVGHFFRGPAPALSSEDLVVTQLFNPLPITNLVHLENNVEIFLLVDNCSDCEPGSKFDELRRFIRSQPATTSFGVAYIEKGQLHIADEPASDRER